MKKIAAITTVFFPLSHADVILSRWNSPRPSDEEWGWQAGKRSQIVSTYIAQFPKDSPDNKNDMSAEYFAANPGVQQVYSIEEALTLGGDELAVDGVLLVGEHGDYPYNEYDQKLYPRKEFFDEIVAVFRRCGKVVPVFCDKHLSWNCEWAREMVATADEMGIPFFAGSTTPLNGFVPEIDLADDEEIEAAMGVFYCGAEVYGFHSIEMIQQMLLQHRGEKKSAVAVTAYGGDRALSQLTGEDKELARAALQVAKGAADIVADPWETIEADKLTLFCFEHRDGSVSKHLRLDGAVKDFIAAVRIKGDPQVRAGRAKMGGAETFYGHFASLNHLIEEMIVTGKPVQSIDRVLMSTIMIAKAMHALHQPGTRVTIE